MVFNVFIYVSLLCAMQNINSIYVSTNKICMHIRLILYKQNWRDPTLFARSAMIFMSSRAKDVGALHIRILYLFLRFVYSD